MRTLKKTLACIAIIIVVTILVSSIFKYNYKQESTNKIIDNINETIGNSNINNEDKETKYLDMTEENYPSSDDKSFEWNWTDVQKNSNGTYTIYGRVYEKQNLPKLTKEQYIALENGEEIEIFGIALKKDNSDEVKNSSYDMILNDPDDIFFAYVSCNSDGTADLMYYSEFCIGKATDTYLKITINKDTPCYVGDTVFNEFGFDTFENKYYLYKKAYEEYPFDDFGYNEDYKKIVWWGDFIFESGECKGISFTEM